MVGHHNARRTGLHSLFRTLGRHDAFQDKGHPGFVGDLLQLLHRFAARGRGQVLQKGQARRINVHRQRKAAGLPCHRHFLGDGRIIPRLDGGDAEAAVGRNGRRCALHHLGVGAVAGKGGNARSRAGWHQDGIIIHIVVLVAVVQRHSAYRPGKERIFERTAKQLQTGIRGKILVDGVHVQPHAAPGVKVADRHRAAALGTRAGDVAAAGAAVAHGAGMAGAHLPAGRLQQFFVIHDFASLKQRASGFAPEAAVSYRTLLKKSMVRGCFGWSMTSSGVPSSTM